MHIFNHWFVLESDFFELVKTPTQGVRLSALLAFKEPLVAVELGHGSASKA
jgi:hypothetical protein